MKRLLSVILAAVLSLSVLSGCSQAEDKKLVVGASPTPHAEILKQAAPLLEEKGYQLEIKEFSDYVLPNTSLQDGELDANYFQHITYLDTFNAENGTDLVSAGSIHYEPFGIYAGRTKTLEELPDGGKISVPNDTSNEARALLLLESLGLITLKEGVGLNATVIDIAENPKNLQIVEIGAEQLVNMLPDVDFAVINGNYAIQGGLKVADALAIEGSDSVAVTNYANVVAVRAGDETREDIQALVEVLKSDTIKEYMEETYGGAVVPVE